ncbi:deaminase [Novosphingobium gossypii]|uniref:deaminase n=1 Tax=Novosphingobium gossypii TaxID=1604774 RepID=UPI003D1AB3D6
MPQAEHDEGWMRKAIETARSKSTDPSTSLLGCLIVLAGRIHAGGRNQPEKLPAAKAHAEAMEIWRGREDTGEMELRCAMLYFTPQPCVTCTMASIWLKIGTVIYGAEEQANL